MPSANVSLRSYLRTLTRQQKERLAREAPAALLSIFNWEEEDARDNQLLPEGDWRICAFMSGRGWGKTRTAAEAVKKHALLNPRARIAVAAPTFGDGRDICFEGESGLEKIIPAAAIRHWNRSLGEMILNNG